MSDSCIISLENQWKTKTVAANALFEKDAYNLAMEGYNEALYKAEALNLHATHCLRANIPYVQIFIISCNNLANTHEALGNFEKTDKMLRRSVYYLLSLVNNKQNKPSIIQSELQRATLAYSNFIDKQGKGNLKTEQVFKHLKQEFLKEGYKL